jgi:hypothetical protein
MAGEIGPPGPMVRIRIFMFYDEFCLIHCFACNRVRLVLGVIPVIQEPMVSQVMASKVK